MRNSSSGSRSGGDCDNITGRGKGTCGLLADRQIFLNVCKKKKMLKKRTTNKKKKKGKIL